MASLSDPLMRYWHWWYGGDDEDLATVPSAYRAALDNLTSALTTAGCTIVSAKCGRSDKHDSYSGLSSSSHGTFSCVEFTGYPKVDSEGWESDIAPAIAAFESAVTTAGFTSLSSLGSESADVV